MTLQEQTNTATKSPLQRLYIIAIGQPVSKWYLHALADQLPELSDVQRIAVERQAVIGWLQTVLFVIVVIQSLFAGALRVLPPDLRASVGFLHRIEWGVYVAMILIATQVFLGWRSGILLTNRFYLLAWHIGNPKLVIGSGIARIQIGSLFLILILVVASIWVHMNGFIVQPAQ